MTVRVGQPKFPEIFYDIRKLYTFRTPGPELQQHIEFFSETSVAAMKRFIQTEKFIVALFPSFTPTIWINLGPPYNLSNGTTTRRIHKNLDVAVLRSTLLERDNFSTDHIFTIKFNTLGFESIFGVSQSRLGNEIVSAADILPDGVTKKLREPIDLEEKSLFLEKFFLDKLYRNSSDQFHLHCIRRAIDHFVNSNMNIRVSETASKLHICEKTFNRYFHQIVGTNPKYFFSIIRCRRALTEYNRHPERFSPYDFGYYDFSHFSKDTLRFTGNNLSYFYNTESVRFLL
jgi:AraC-like DNA-binding protein